MKIVKQHALVSWCPDLMDPKGQPVPVAVLLVAKENDDLIATVAGYRVDADMDPITAAILRDVTVVVRSHVDRLIIKEDASLSNILHGLASSLRGNLHVAKISEESVEEVKEVEVALLRRALALLTSSVEEFVDSQEQVRAPRAAIPQQRPVTLSWPIQLSMSA